MNFKESYLECWSEVRKYLLHHKRVFKIRVFLMLMATLAFSASTVFAQLRVEILSAKYIDASTLRVFAQIQNIGSRAMVFIPYGQAAMHIDPNEEKSDEIGILLRYRSQGMDKIVKNLPSSVTIKTRFGGSIGAEMFQEIASTGTTNYQLWEIVFSVPYNVLEVSVDVFGVVHRIQDREDVILAERASAEKADRIIAEANVLVAEGRYREALHRYGLALGVQYRSRSELGENYTKALYAVGSESMNSLNYEEAAKYLSRAYRYAKEYNLSNKSKIAHKLVATYVQLGKMKQQANLYGDALWFFQEAKKLDGTNIEAQKGVLAIEQRRRNPTTATLLSIVPGVGQFYNGRTVEGALFLAGGALFGTAAVVNLFLNEEKQTRSAFETSPSDKAQLAFYLYGALAVWSMYRANRQAHYYNDKLYQQTRAVDRYRIGVTPLRNGVNFAFSIKF